MITKRDHHKEITLCDLIRSQSVVSFWWSLFSDCIHVTGNQSRVIVKNRVMGQDRSHATESNCFGDLPLGLGLPNSQRAKALADV